MATGTMLTPSRITLHRLNAATSSKGRNGLVSRLPRLRDHISSMKVVEKPILERNRMSHSSTEPISTPARLRQRARGPGQIFLQEAPGQHLQEGPIDELDQPDAGAAQQIDIAHDQRADAAERSAHAGLRQQDRLGAARDRDRRAHDAFLAGSTSSSGLCNGSRARPRTTSRNTSSSVRVAVGLDQRAPACRPR